MELKLVKCEQDFWNDILIIRNEDKDSFNKQHEISLEEHQKFMNINAINYRVATIDGKFAGFVGIVNDDIRVGVKKEYRKMGIGKFMINEFYKIFEINHAKIKINNIASQKLFESCGFKKSFYILTKNET
jgi:ribosomal protein S18 acetylase RimI-like enzyme